APRTHLISNLTGKSATAEITRADYWRRHARQPVRYIQGIEQLLRMGYEIFVEIGPHPTLLGMARNALPAAAGAWLPSLRKGRDDGHEVDGGDASPELHAGSVDWAGFDAQWTREKLALPTYPLDRAAVRVAKATGEPPRSIPVSQQGSHPLLGQQ